MILVKHSACHLPGSRPRTALGIVILVFVCGPLSTLDSSHLCFFGKSILKASVLWENNFSKMFSNALKHSSAVDREGVLCGAHFKTVL